jgi:hypothetical protein
MAGKNTATFGIYPDRGSADIAVETLKANGFKVADISLFLPETPAAGILVGMGIPEYEAKRYEGRLQSGDILVSVHCKNSEWTKKAIQLLENTDAEDVASAGESEADFFKSDRPMLRSDALTDPRNKKAS